MSIYLNRLFPRSNSSLFLSSGKALQSQVLRISEEKFLVDAGTGTPRTCMQDELTKVPINKSIIRFENKVGFLNRVTGESHIRRNNLEGLFIDLLAGDSVRKETAVSKFNDLVGSTDVVSGETHLLLPRRFRQNRAWMRLNKIWRMNSKVKGFIVDKVPRGYAVAIAGFVAFLPSNSYNKRITRRIPKEQFTIDIINPKVSKIKLS